MAHVAWRGRSRWKCGRSNRGRFCDARSTRIPEGVHPRPPRRGWRMPFDSSTLSAGSVRRRLDLTGRGQVDHSPSTASTRRSRWPPHGGDSAFLLSLRLLRRVSCRRPLRLGLCVRESVHHRLAFQSDGAAGCSSPALEASHRRRGFEPCGMRHTTASGLCRQQQHCLGGLSAAATRFDRARHGPDPTRLNPDRPRR